LPVRDLANVSKGYVRSLRVAGSGGEPAPVAQRSEPVRRFTLELAAALLADTEPTDLSVRVGSWPRGP
jgi:hypothetical protein